LLADNGATDAQTYTVTSSNADIGASIATGPFWNVGVSYTDPTNSANNFTGTLTSQLFQSLTPTTVTNISNLTNDGYFVNTGKYFSRIISGFVVQGGSPTLDGEEPNPPVSFGTEILQQLAFTGTYQLGMAHSSLPDSDTSQFFITLASQDSLDYGYTVFGQLLTGVNTVNLMAAVPVMANTNPNGTGEVSQPDNPITITSASLSSTNPNGTLIIDTTQAEPNETATITVTATDPANKTTATQSFVVTVGSYAGPTNPPINFRPFAAAATVQNVPTDTAQQVQLFGMSGYQGTPASTLSFAILSQPMHGKITDFNSATGALTYTPDPGFGGIDSLRYQVTATGPQSSPATTVSNPGTVTFIVGAQKDTGAVTQIGKNLVVTPLPSRARPTNTIEVSQIPETSSTSVIAVTVNGVVDSTMVSPTDLDRIIAFGGRNANNDIYIDPGVTVPSTISSGQGLKNRLIGGSVETREHGWYGHTTLIGGTGPNQLIGLAGHVRFKPTKTTNLIYTAQPRRRTNQLNPVPPIQTFYKFRHGRLIAIPATVFKAPPFKRHKLEE